MKSSIQASASRREFIKNTGKFAAVSALANVAIPAVHAAGSDVIQVALIGCGRPFVMAALSPARPGNRTPSFIGRSLPAWRPTVGPEVAAFIESQICCYHSFALAPELLTSSGLPLFTDSPEQVDFGCRVQVESLIEADGRSQSTEASVR